MNTIVNTMFFFLDLALNALKGILAIIGYVCLIGQFVIWFIRGMTLSDKFLLFLFFSIMVILIISINYIIDQAIDFLVTKRSKD